jgi:GDP-L-fucose synthase
VDLNRKILVTGSAGLVGRAIVRELYRRGFEQIVTTSSTVYDLRDQYHTDRLFREHRPDYVFHCAAKVGGIVGHLHQAIDMFRDNILMELNVITNAHKWGVEKLLFLGSACAYPKHAATPVKEESLLTGALEPSNELYALAKISGIKLCDAFRTAFNSNFISTMPTNMYGPGDNYHPRFSHVIPGMIRKFHEAFVAGDESVVLWGTGKPIRDFLYSDDAASAFVTLMERWNQPGPVNVCSGAPVELWQLADAIREVTFFKGEIIWDSAYPDGTPDRTMDASKIKGLGWEPKVPLATGLEIAYADFLRRCL